MSDVSSESTLIRAAIAGDRVALSQLLFAHAEPLERHISLLLARESLESLALEDVMQQTYVQAARAIANYQERSAHSFGAWLKTIGGNLVRDAQRRRRRERRRIVPDAPAGDVSEAPAGFGQLEAETTSPSMRVHRGESRARIRTAISELPPDEREVIERHYLQHQTLEQIAQAMDRSKDAIRGLCFRARRRLRDQMGRSSWFFSS